MIRALFIVFLVGAVWASWADLVVLEKKAQGGDAEAQYLFGEIHYEARGVKQDLAAAKDWLTKAANADNSKAKYRLASMLFTGVGFKADAKAALAQFTEVAPGLEKLAKAGDADAAGKLGVLYNLGVGVKGDAKRAVELFRQSAERGNAKGQLDLAGAYLLGKGVKKNPTSAVDWFEKAAKAGHAQAQIQAGILCIQGRGQRQDIAGGMKWLEMAAKSGHPGLSGRATQLIARLKKFPPRKGEDIDGLIAKAKGGELAAQVDLGERFQVGNGVRVNLVESANWLMLAAAQGDAKSAYRLGGYYVVENALPRNALLASQLWRLSAWLGHSPAQVDFAVMCAKGDGIPRDLKEAYHWMLIGKRGDHLPHQKANLEAIQELIQQELDPDLIFSGLTASRQFKPPKTEAERKAIAAAVFGDGKAMFAHGKSLTAHFPDEALVWLRLAEVKKIEGAAVAAKAAEAKLSDKLIAIAAARVKAFKPLVLPK